jgi:hypothetical protein
VTERQRRRSCAAAGAAPAAPGRRDWRGNEGERKRGRRQRTRRSVRLSVARSMRIQPCLAPRIDRCTHARVPMRTHRHQQTTAAVARPSSSWRAHTRVLTGADAAESKAESRRKAERKDNDGCGPLLSLTRRSSPSPASQPGALRRAPPVRGARAAAAQPRAGVSRLSARCRLSLRSRTCIACVGMSSEGAGSRAAPPVHRRRAPGAPTRGCARHEAARRGARPPRARSCRRRAPGAENRRLRVRRPARGVILPNPACLRPYVRKPSLAAAPAAAAPRAGKQGARRIGDA